jgi:UDP-N-acetylmuramate: L-alanyl-gamma-D-glutamyl-meso-diaminopimelate ligase
MQKRIHLISIGGAVMHNIALELKDNGHIVSGSDDEIYNPSRQRLADVGLLPDEMGWFPERITPDLDVVILGMHAREGNPEIERARELDIPVLSFPEFIYQQSKDKTRVVIAGSHGKTTTTSMIMYALKKAGKDFDYLVGGQIEGFQKMVRLSDAPLIILEGDEYLSSALDRRPKMLHYKAHFAVITGIAWDHMNVFPTFDNYREQFDLFVESVEDGAKIFCYEPDPEVQTLIERNVSVDVDMVPYREVTPDQMKRIQVFGPHNRANLRAAELICIELGLRSEQFFDYLATFTGTARRLQVLIDNDAFKVYQDFAHAPSKLKATVEAVREKFPGQQLYAFYELHTYSSLNKDFIVHYKGTMEPADEAVVFFNAHTLAMKKMPELSIEFVENSFAKEGLKVMNQQSELVDFIRGLPRENTVFLFMSSGTFEGLDILALFE